MHLPAIGRARSSYIEISRFWYLSNRRDRINLRGISSRHIWHVTGSEQRRHFRNAPCLLQDPDIQYDKTDKTIQLFKESLNNHKLHDTKKSVRGIRESFERTSEERIVVLRGYLGVRSDLSKKLSFAPLRDVAYEDQIQIVSAPSDVSDLVHGKLKSVRPYEPVIVKGRIKRKLTQKTNAESNSSLPKNAREAPEILLQDIVVLNSLHPDVILKDGAEYGPERRFLRLRTDGFFRNALSVRDKIMRLCLHNLALDSTHIETPLLYRSTSEGANEFLVPTRRKGLAYALPQSPQQFKQILMASGIHRYHQLARCFRDEDLRADRQPEFTQLDIERSFAKGSEIRSSVENQLVTPIWKSLLDVEIHRPFRTMTYHDAMSDYGSDKPDLRIPYKIRPRMQAILPCDLVGKITSLTDPIIDALVIPFTAPPDQVRNFVSQFLESSSASIYHKNPVGGPGIFVYDSSKPLNGLSAFGFEAMETTEDVFKGLEDGHLIVLQARKNEPFSGGSTELGNMRIALHSAAVEADLLPPLSWKYFEPLWVIDFPLFSPSVENEPGQGGKAGFKSTHHPFTSPKSAEDVDLLLSDPTKAVGDHYDLVINGEEIGGGSCRIHHAAMQEFIFRDILKMEEEKIAEFSPLLEALKAACPPHAGIALGFDRLVAMVYSHMLGKKVSMRDVIAFPKTGSGEDSMMKSPGRMSQDQLQRNHLKLLD